jgi:hypothetical protein
MSKETEYGYAWENGFDCGMDKGRKQGAVEELEKLKKELLGKLDYFFDDESLKISNEYIRRRLKELKED